MARCLPMLITIFDRFLFQIISGLALIFSYLGFFSKAWRNHEPEIEISRPFWQSFLTFRYPNILLFCTGLPMSFLNWIWFHVIFQRDPQRPTSIYIKINAKIRSHLDLTYYWIIENTYNFVSAWGRFLYKVRFESDSDPNFPTFSISKPSKPIYSQTKLALFQLIDITFSAFK